MVCVFIEILPQDKTNNFLEIDDNLFKDEESLEYIYLKKSVYILYYLKGGRAAMNSGIVKRNPQLQFYIFYKMNIDKL